MSSMRRFSDEFHEGLEREMEGREFKTIEEAQAFLDECSARFNRRPVDEFCGLSPEQMMHLLRLPWNSPDYVEFAEELDASPEAPVMLLFQALEVAIGEKGLKPTAAGNLPVELVRSAADAFLGRYPEQNPFFPMRREDDFLDLHVTRLVAGLAGLVRKHNRRFILSRMLRDWRKQGREGAIYPALMGAFVRRYNWGYADAYPELDIVQQSLAFSLYLLWRFGGEWRPISFYADAFVRAFPQTLDEVRDQPYSQPETVIRRCYRNRVLQRFAWFFGLVEIRGNIQHGLVSLDCELRKLPLLDKVAIFSPSLPR